MRANATIFGSPDIQPDQKLPYEKTPDFKQPYDKTLDQKMSDWQKAMREYAAQYKSQMSKSHH